MTTLTTGTLPWEWTVKKGGNFQVLGIPDATFDNLGSSNPTLPSFIMTCNTNAGCDATHITYANPGSDVSLTAAPAIAIAAMNCGNAFYYQQDLNNGIIEQVSSGVVNGLRNVHDNQLLYLWGSFDHDDPTVGIDYHTNALQQSFFDGSVTYTDNSYIYRNVIKYPRVNTSAVSLGPCTGIGSTNVFAYDNLIIGPTYGITADGVAQAPTAVAFQTPRQ